MRISIKTLMKGLCAVALLAAVASCGSSSNDQGVSFTLFGFFKSASGDGDAGQFVPLSTDTESANATHSVRTYYGLQNNLAVMGIRTQRVFLSYYVDGATVQPPSTSQAFGTVLGPAGGSSSGSSSSSGVNGGGSLPPGFSNIKSTIKQEVLIVPPDIMAWLNFNRASLPELPFTMTVRTYVTGLTTAGDRIDSNTLDYIVEFVPDNIIPPSGGSGGNSSGSGSTGSSGGTGSAGGTGTSSSSASSSSSSAASSSSSSAGSSSSSAASSAGRGI